MAALYRLERPAVYEQVSSVQAAAESVGTARNLPAQVRNRSVALAYRSSEQVRRIGLSDFGVRTIIDEALDVQGSIKGTSSVAIKGSLTGDIVVAGDSGLVVIFPGAVVKGRVRARFVWLAGRLEGRVECSRLLALAGGHFSGESVCETLEIRHGAEYLPTLALKEPFDCSRDTFGA